MPEKAMPSHCIRSHVWSHSPLCACLCKLLIWLFKSLIRDKLWFSDPWLLLGFFWQCSPLCLTSGSPRLSLGLPLPYSTSKRISSAYMFPVPGNLFVDLNMKGISPAQPSSDPLAQTPGLISAWVSQAPHPHPRPVPPGWILLHWHKAPSELWPAIISKHSNNLAIR